MTLLVSIISVYDPIFFCCCPLCFNGYTYYSTAFRETFALFTDICSWNLVYIDCCGYIAVLDYSLYWLLRLHSSVGLCYYMIDLASLLWFWIRYYIMFVVHVRPFLLFLTFLLLYMIMIFLFGQDSLSIEIDYVI